MAEVKKTVYFVFEKQTKGAVRYKEVNKGATTKKDDYLVGSIYFRKDELDMEDDNYPKTMKATFRFDNG